mmetsp:Transcript_16802/g.54551  ORF Transcript_16802/g.54551 Transcript_16802/m.54551 type:complete len:245 (-) Transcript_16802:972-1706(-)
MPRREPNAATASPAAHAADAASRASGSQRLGGQARLATRRQGGLALVAAPLLDARRRARHCGHAAARQDRRPDPRQHTSVATPMAMACLGSASGGATARRTDGAARRSSRAANRGIASAAPPHLRGGCPGESRMRPPPRQLHTLPTPPHGRAARSGSADRPGSLRGDRAASPSSRLLYSTHGVERATAATQRRVRTAAPTLASTHPSPPRWRWRALARLAAERQRGAPTGPHGPPLAPPADASR